MLLSMIVTITSWAPVRALSTPGMPPHSAAAERPRRDDDRDEQRAGDVGQPAEGADPRGRGGAHEQLALHADVEQAGPEGEGHGERRRR